MNDIAQASPAGRATRNRVVWTAKVLTSFGETNVRVRDLSSTGARLLCELELRANEDVVLKRGDLFSAAHVVWVNDGEVGIEFYRPIEVTLAD